MDERRGAIGADQFDAAVEEQITEQRRKDADKDEAGDAFGIENKSFSAGEFQDRRRDEHQRAAAHAEGEERERMHERPRAQHCRVERIDQQRHDEPHVAAVESDVEQNLETAAADDDDDAGERDADAAGLPQRQPVAEQNKTPQRDEQRADRLQQQTVDCGRVLQAVIGHRVVGREAGKREKRHQAGMLADDRPIADEMPRGEWQQNRESAGPADERQRYRRYMPGDEPAEYGIAGPEQGRQRQQQIRLVEQPAAGAARTLGWTLGWASDLRSRHAYPLSPTLRQVS